MDGAGFADTGVTEFLWMELVLLTAGVTESLWMELVLLTTGVTESW